MLRGLLQHCVGIKTAGLGGAHASAPVVARPSAVLRRLILRFRRRYLCFHCVHIRSRALGPTLNVRTSLEQLGERKQLAKSSGGNSDRHGYRTHILRCTANTQVGLIAPITTLTSAVCRSLRYTGFLDLKLHYANI